MNISIIVRKDYCHYKIKFISDDYLQMYKTLQLFTSLFTIITNIFTSIKVINRAKIYRHSYLKCQARLRLGRFKTVHCSGPNEIM